MELILNLLFVVSPKTMFNLPVSLASLIAEFEKCPF